jgi:hypothetical protein
MRGQSSHNDQDIGTKVFASLPIQGMHGRKAVQILNTLQELQGMDYTPAELAGMTEDVMSMT